jgi:hypothetical protein
MQRESSQLTNVRFAKSTTPLNTQTTHAISTGTYGVNRTEVIRTIRACFEIRGGALLPAPLPCGARQASAMRHARDMSATCEARGKTIFRLCCPPQFSHGRTRA